MTNQKIKWRLNYNQQSKNEGRFASIWDIAGNGFYIRKSKKIDIHEEQSVAIAKIKRVISN